jgi:hypothetical protein
MSCGVTIEDIQGILNVQADPTRDEQIGWALDAACALWAHRTGRVDPENPGSVAQVTEQGRMFVTLAATRHYMRFSAPFGIAGDFDTGPVYVMSRDPDLQAMLTGERLSFGVG